MNGQLCPWCYIGHKDLERGIAQARAADLPVDFVIQYHPYILNPSMTCSETKTKKEYFERKFGVEGAAKMRALLMARGKEEGITLCVSSVAFCAGFWFLALLLALYMLLLLLLLRSHVLVAVILFVPWIRALLRTLSLEASRLGLCPIQCTRVVMSVLTFAVLLCGFVLPLGGELALLSHFFVPRSGRSSDASAVLWDDVGRAVVFFYLLMWT